MIRIFYASLLLTISSCTILSLDVPKELSPLNREPFTERWRSFTNNLGDNRDNNNKNIELVNTASGTQPLDHEKLLSEKSRHLWTYPSVVTGMRILEYKYYLEILCFDADRLDRFLQLAPEQVNGFRDFNPLKAILTSARVNGLTQKHEKCIKILLENGIDLEKPFPTHNGFGLDQDTGFENCKPLEYFDKAREAQEAGLISHVVIDKTTCNNIKRLFTDKVEQTKAAQILLTQQQPKSTITQPKWYQRIPILKITGSFILLAALGFATRWLPATSWLPTNKFNFSFLPIKK